MLTDFPFTFTREATQIQVSDFYCLIICQILIFYEVILRDYLVIKENSVDHRVQGAHF